MSVSIETLLLAKKLAGGGGGNYNQLTNLPSVNGVELRGNKTAEQLGLMSEESAEDLENAKQVTYAELKALRDNSQLVPGMLYRITDYVTTINGTIDLREIGAYDSYITDESRPPKWFHYARSAGHQFDLVVMAVGENELDGSARACHHEGDTYFANSNLGTWQLKYTIDNDRTKYSFADPVNGKGVITWMRDEFNNECFYDFKNVQYLCYALEMEDTSAQKDYLCYDPTLGSTTDIYKRVMRYGNPCSIFWAIDDWMYKGGEEDFVSPFKKHKLIAQDIITTCIDYPTVDDTYLQTFNAEWYYTFTGLTVNTIEDISLNFNKLDISMNGGKCCNNYISYQAEDFVFWWDGYIDDREPSGLPSCIVFTFANIESNSCYFRTLRNNQFTRETLGSVIGSGVCYNTFGVVTNLTVFDINTVNNNSIQYISDSICTSLFNNNTILNIRDVACTNMYDNFMPDASFDECDLCYFDNNYSIKKIRFYNDVFRSISKCMFNGDMTHVEANGSHPICACVFDKCYEVVFTCNNPRYNYMNYEQIGSLMGTSDNKLNISLSSNGNNNRDYTICIGMNSNGQLKEWIPAEGLSASDVPSKTSDLTNDSGFLTLATLPIWDGGVSG